MSERDARLYLSIATEPGDPQIAAAVLEFGAEQAWEQLINPTSDPSRPAAVRAKAVKPERIMEEASHANARFVIPGDPEWPTRLADLDGVPPINEKAGVPLGLWIMGAGNLADLVTAADRRLPRLHNLRRDHRHRDGR